MRRLSSRATFWYKRIFPVVWFGILGLFIIVSLFGGFANANSGVPFLLGPVVMIGFGFFMMKKLIFDLVDEVDDDGSGLIVRNGGRSDRIALSDVMNVNYSAYMSPPRVDADIAEAECLWRSGHLLRTASIHSVRDRSRRR